MSNPCLVQFTFKIKSNMPTDMKKFLLFAFTNYYTEHYPAKKPDHKTDIVPLFEKYPQILDMWRNDAYHNVDLQTCQLDSFDLYDIDTNETLDKDNENEQLPLIGISIISLPRSIYRVDDFLRLIAPYITSHYPTIGIVTLDSDEEECYYYYFKNGYIKKQLLNAQENDEIVCEWSDDDF